jgi:oligoribonuclease (3'-5' exoribonuclease)
MKQAAMSGKRFAVIDCETTGLHNIDRVIEMPVVVVDSSLDSMLVAADPTSQSRRAKEAREYGVPVISESDFLAYVAA